MKQQKQRLIKINNKIINKGKSFIFLLGQMILFIIWAFILGIIGFGLPVIINKLNGFNYDSFYGHIASYMISMILFWFIMREYSFSEKKIRK